MCRQSRTQVIWSRYPSGKGMASHGAGEPGTRGMSRAGWQRGEEDVLCPDGRQVFLPLPERVLLCPSRRAWLSTDPGCGSKLNTTIPLKRMS